MRQGFSRGRRDAQVALFRFRPRSQKETPPIEDEDSGSVALILASSIARCAWWFPHGAARPGMADESHGAANARLRGVPQLTLSRNRTVVSHGEVISVRGLGGVCRDSYQYEPGGRDLET